MRIWSLHPKYLDSKGLVALWRETLLAQNVLCGNTKGYKNHPQLNRFKDNRNPLGAIAIYLKHVHQEAEERGYNFNKDKIVKKRINGNILVTSGQLEYEFNHLLNKLKKRDYERYKNIKNESSIETHPLFNEVEGGVEEWEMVN